MQSRVSVLAFLAALPFTAQAVDGTINFTGAIIANGCTIQGGPTLNVDLGTYGKEQLTSLGDKTPKRPFTLSLSACPALPAKITLEGLATAAPGGNLFDANTATTKVAIEVSHNNNVLRPYEAYSLGTLAAGANNFQFAGRFVATAATIAVGSINTPVTFTLSYP